MKRVYSIAFIFLILLTGCKNKTTTTVCRFPTLSGDEHTETFKSVDDVVKTDEMVYVYDYTDRVKSGDFTTDDIKDEYDRMKGKYSDTDGMKYNYRMEGAKVIETIIFDYDVVDFDVLVEMELLSSGKYDYISLKQTVENLENAGYTCEAGH